MVDLKKFPKNPTQASLNPNNDHLPPKSDHLSPKINNHQQLVNIYTKCNHSLPKMFIYELLTSNPPECQDCHQN